MLAKVAGWVVICRLVRAWTVRARHEDASLRLSNMMAYGLALESRERSWRY